MRKLHYLFYAIPVLFFVGVAQADDLVANPRLFEPECRSPRQMRLANGFCRFGEMADEGNSNG